MGEKHIFHNIRVFLDAHMRRLRINRKYKDRLFCALFGEDKEALLQLYNALHGTAYTDPDRLTVVTLDNIIYMKMVNDLAFVIAGVLNLYEHQSTYNPNMPLRFLLYIAEEYDRMVHRQDVDIYGSGLVMLPTPQCVVFYNGSRETEDEELLRLSDSFQNKDIPADLELTVHLRNINLGHNVALMDQCHKLWEYASLVGRVNENLADGMSREAAVEEAVVYCLEQGILTDFLKDNRSGVLGMLRLLTEYDEKENMRRIKRDARKEGEKLGEAKGELRRSREVIFDFLDNLGEIPGDIRERIDMQEDADILKKWYMAAPKAENFDAFREEMQALAEGRKR